MEKTTKYTPELIHEELMVALKKHNPTQKRQLAFIEALKKTKVSDIKVTYHHVVLQIYEI